MNKRAVFPFIILLVISGCATTKQATTYSQAGIDGKACLGTIQAPIPGLAEITNPALISQAQLANGKGGTCIAKVFSVTAPVTLYRVFDSTKPHSKLGGWWSLNRPSGSRESYRSAFAICPEWSKLDKVVSCEVRPGTEIVIGTTQSATCADGSTLPKTKENQVFIPNSGKVGIYHTGACAEESAWP